MENKIYQLYLRLLGKHGSPEKFWPNWCSSQKTLREREIILIGAILTQRTAWHNAELALKNLRKNGLLSVDKIAKLKDFNKLKPLIRSAGFYNTKSLRLSKLCSFIVKYYGNLNNFMKEKFSKSRLRLLALPGIGPETADTILLYCLDKPSFIVDEYTRRIVKREKISSRKEYDFLKKLFEKNLPVDSKIYQDFHALIIIDQKGEDKSLMKKY